jgi:hypothetical protein
MNRPCRVTSGPAESLQHGGRDQAVSVAPTMKVVVLGQPDSSIILDTKQYTDN